MLALESYKQEAGKMGTGIVHYMKNCQQNLSNRADRERFYLLLPKYKEKEREQIPTSGLSLVQGELNVLLDEIAEKKKSFTE